MASRADGYERQVGPRAGDIGGVSIGAAMGPGAAIARFGGELEEHERRQRALERADQASDYGVRTAGAQQRMDDLQADLQEKLPAGGAGYLDNVKSALDTEEKAVFEGITDPRLLGRAKESWASYRATVESRARLFEMGAAARARTAGNKTQLEIQSNRLQRADSEADLLEAMQGFADTIEDQPGAEDVKTEAVREASAQLAGAFLLGQADRNPAKAIELLDSGKYDSIIGADQQKAIREHAGVVDRRNDAAAKAEASQLKAERREALATAEALLNAGTGNPEDWSKLAAGYQAVGDTSKAVQAQAKATETAAAIGYRGDTPAQLDQKIADLRAKEAQQGGLGAKDGSLLRGLQGVRSTVGKLVGQSPLLANSFATGAAAPTPINWSDPASIQSRVTAARAAARRYGQVDVKPLLPAETEQLQDVYRREGGKQAVIDQIRLLGDEAGSAARQVASGDAAFIHLADLASSGPAGRSAAADALAGEKAIKAAPGVWTKDIRADAQAAWQSTLPVFATSPALGQAVWKNAAFIYAAEALRDGDTDPDKAEFDEERWARSLDRAVGGDGRGQGGITTVNGAPAIVPEDMSKDAFAKLLARAKPGAWLRAAGGRTAVLGGRAATLGEIRKAVPVALGDGRYGFRIGNGRITTREGAPWAVDIDQLQGD